MIINIANQVLKPKAIVAIPIAANNTLTAHIIIAGPTKITNATRMIINNGPILFPLLYCVIDILLCNCY